MWRVGFKLKQSSFTCSHTVKVSNSTLKLAAWSQNNWSWQSLLCLKRFFDLFISVWSNLLFSFLLKLFIKSNQGDEETTKINYLTFIGTPVQATNMNDFRRVRDTFKSRFFFRGGLCWCSPDCMKNTVILNGCCCLGCGEDRRESLSRRRSRGWRRIQGPSACQSCHTLVT